MVYDKFLPSSITPQIVTTPQVSTEKLTLQKESATRILHDIDTQDITSTDLFSAVAIKKFSADMEETIKGIDPNNVLLQDNTVISKAILPLNITSEEWLRSNWMVYNNGLLYEPIIEDPYNFIKIDNKHITSEEPHFFVINVLRLDSGSLIVKNNANEILASYTMAGIYYLEAQVDDADTTTFMIEAVDVYPNEIIHIGSIGFYRVSIRLQQYMNSYIHEYLTASGEGAVNIQLLQQYINDLSNSLTDMVGVEVGIVDDKLNMHVLDTNPHNTTAASVGAAAINHTHTPVEIGAADRVHTHEAEELPGVAPEVHQHDISDINDGISGTSVISMVSSKMSIDLSNTPMVNSLLSNSEYFSVSDTLVLEGVPSVTVYCNGEALIVSQVVTSKDLSINFPLSVVYYDATSRTIVDPDTGEATLDPGELDEIETIPITNFIFSDEEPTTEEDTIWFDVLTGEYKLKTSTDTEFTFMNIVLLGLVSVDVDGNVFTHQFNTDRIITSSLNYLIDRAHVEVVESLKTRVSILEGVVSGGGGGSLEGLIITTPEALSQMVEGKADTVDLEALQTSIQSQIDLINDEIDNIKLSGGSGDLTDYYTSTQIDELLLDKANNSIVSTIDARLDDAIETVNTNVEDINTLNTAVANINTSIEDAINPDLTSLRDIAESKWTMVEASTTVKGIVQLSNALDSEDETLAATSLSIKNLHDLIGVASGTADSKLDVSGGVITGDLEVSGALDVKGTLSCDRLIIAGQEVEVKITQK